MANLTEEVRMLRQQVQAAGAVAGAAADDQPPFPAELPVCDLQGLKKLLALMEQEANQIILVRIHFYQQSTLINPPLITPTLDNFVLNLIYLH